MATTGPLTEREQQALEEMRKAQEQGLTLKEHAAKTGMDVQQLYQLRRRLVLKGAFGPVPHRKTPKSSKTDAFVPVRVVPVTPVLTDGALRCRLVHPGGWVLECDGLPPASWIAAVLTGGAHAAS
jgi:hypothetical protein